VTYVDSRHDLGHGPVAVGVGVPDRARETAAHSEVREREHNVKEVARTRSSSLRCATNGLGGLGGGCANSLGGLGSHVYVCVCVWVLVNGRARQQQATGASSNQRAGMGASESERARMTVKLEGSLLGTGIDCLSSSDR